MDFSSQSKVRLSEVSWLKNFEPAIGAVQCFFSTGNDLGSSSAKFLWPFS